MITQTKHKIGNFDCVVIRDDSCETPRAAVILCHGFGAPSTDLVSLGEQFLNKEGASKDIVYVFPAAPVVLDPLFDTRAWWMIDIERVQQLMMQGETRELRSNRPDELPSLRKSFINLIDMCRVDFRLDPEKVIIGGFSQGAMLATDVALHYHDVLGGVIVWSGNLISEVVWAEKSKSLVATKFVQSHGRLDPVLPMSGAEDLRDMLRSHGHDVRFFEFAGQHSIPLESVELSAQLIEEVVDGSKP